jgi:outer membrane lipoprotein LolB
VFGLTLLAACQTLPPPPVGNTDFQANQRALLAHEQWSLKGRLNVRQDKQSDTVEIYWQQQAQRFDISFRSAVLGLGTTRVFGIPTSVTVEKAGETPVTLPSLAAVTQHYLQFEFPATQLLYWVRGLPAPGVTAATEFDEHSRLASLTQRDNQGRDWQLNYDRYSEVAGMVVPNRIRLSTGNLQLTFLVNADGWQLGSSAP